MVKYSPMAAFFCWGREKDSVVSQLEGVLLISKGVFQYFMLVALEAGGPLRGAVLLAAAPLLALLEVLGWEKTALRVMIFVSTAGLRVAEVKAVAKATLPRFFLQDTAEKVYGMFAACGGKRYVVTSMPRIMVEPFIVEYLDGAGVVGAELTTFRGRCLGVAAPPGSDALKAVSGVCGDLDVGLAEGPHRSFLNFCREAYYVPPEGEASVLPRKSYPKPLIFHDGRLVAPPSPINALALMLWLPAGILLAATRAVYILMLPLSLQPALGAALGVRIRAKVAPTAVTPGSGKRKTGTVYACSHRTLLDPVFASVILQRKVAAVTYSLSALPGARWEMMRRLLETGDLMVCPEGTTCREPYLLRFSSLSQRSPSGSYRWPGHKCFDAFFFLMNPRPWYRLEFLDRVSGDGGTSNDVANRVQREIARVLSFECTNFTRRDKYWIIAGTDGLVESKK
ncbi:unnamed protein product [Spirodela intermedia]|uniref:Glycerol-3-phosphate acyltransferase RAM2/GPAT1-8 HAD-like domain-containing protein n=1 Tax=Spirodela intermedia TaxID=51605 RepID=A0A7I8JPQ1_SPIIN|nr:unnamed protein product [Spirodela intermedia]CAA6671775.1 unnamed protein product [Spirodela intermedia]